MTDSSRTGSGSGPRRPRVAGLRKRDARNTPSAGGANGSHEQDQAEAEERQETGPAQENGQSRENEAEQVPAESPEAPAESAAGTGSSEEASTAEGSSAEESSPAESSPAESSPAESSAGGATAGDAAAQSDESDTRTLDANSLPGSESAEAGATRSDAQSSRSGAPQSGTPQSGTAEGDESEPTVVVGDGAAGADASAPSGKSSPAGESVRSGKSASAGRSEPAEGSRKSATSGSGTGSSGSSAETSAGSADTSARGEDGKSTASASEADADASGSGSVRSWSSRRTATAVLLIAAVLFGGLAFFFRQGAAPLMGDSGENDALVDAAETSAVNGQAKEAVSKVFSYDFANTAKAESEAKKQLVGPAVEQYDQLFATVKQQAPQQKLVVTTSVKESGVKRLQGDRAEVLAFVNQNATRTETKENSTGQAQISLGMVKQGDQWKINNITQR